MNQHENTGSSAMHLVQIFLPLYDEKGRAIPRRHFESTAAELSERFGGLTAYTRAPATGVWKKQSGRTSRDDIIIYEVMCPRLQRRWWKAKRLALAKIFRQETILIRSHPITQL
jgi:hypothetical protein